MRFKDILLFHTGKDGGPSSRVDGFWIIRIKSLCTVALLRFSRGSREAFHSHAFNSVSWVLSGALMEVHAGGTGEWHWPRLLPIITKRDTFHKVYGLAPSNWVLTFRGPWAKTWKEIDERGYLVTLTHNRKEMDRRPLTDL